MPSPYPSDGQAPIGLLHLLGSREIGDLLGRSRQRIHQLADRPDFPAPFQTLGGGRVWWEADVLAWAKAWRAGEPAVNTLVPGRDDPLFRRLAERIADYLGEHGYAFIEDDQIDDLAQLLRCLFLAAGIAVSHQRR